MLHHQKFSNVDHHAHGIFLPTSGRSYHNLDGLFRVGKFVLEIGYRSLGNITKKLNKVGNGIIKLGTQTSLEQPLMKALNSLRNNEISVFVSKIIR